MKLRHPMTGEPLPPVITVKQAAEILGQAENSVLQDCRDGFIETLPRRGKGKFQIITAKLLCQLGLLDEPPSKTNPLAN